MVAPGPAPLDDNPYSPPGSAVGSPSASPFVPSFEITGGTPFRGELTPEDVASAERLHARTLAISPWTAIAIFVSAVVPVVLGVLTQALPAEGLVVIGVVAICLVLTERWQAGRKAAAVDLPASPFAGVASHQGLRFESPRWTCQFRWSEVLGYVADEELAVLYLPVGPVALPKRAFAGEQAWARFCETILRSGIKPQA